MQGFNPKILFTKQLFNLHTGYLLKADASRMVYVFILWAVEHIK